MANSSLLSSSQHIPARATSLPSREHPISLKFDAILNHLKAWQILSSSETAPFGAERIQIGLVGVAELYGCVDEILGTQNAQRSILRYESGKLVEEALDASVTLLDTCSILKDILVVMKEHVLSLQSAFRRKGSNFSSMESDVYAYISSRKKVQKDVVECQRRLKKLEKKVSCSTLMDFGASDQNVSTVARVLTESNTIIISIFRFLLSYLSMPAKKKFGSCSFVSRMVSFKRSSSCDREKRSKDDFKSLDFSVFNLEAENSKAEVKTIRTLLETLNLSVDSLDTELQCVFKRLVQNRVTLLNILTL